MGGASATFSRRYLLQAAADAVQRRAGRRSQGVTAIVQNGSPFTYFQDRPIEVAEGAALDSGALAGLRASPRDAARMPFIAWRALSPRARVVRHRQVTGLPGVTELTVRSADGRPLPLQVDGDYLGEVAEARYSILPARAERRLLSEPAALSARGLPLRRRRPASPGRRRTPTRCCACA